MLSRRRFIQGAAALAAAGAAGAAYAHWWEPEWLEFTEHALPVPGLPPSLDSRILAQISDIHCGPRVSMPYLRRSFSELARRQPEIVVVTGDWVTYDGPRAIERLARLLETMPRGRLGTFGILGNHDYGDGWRDELVAESITRCVSNAGVRMLRNESAGSGGLTLVGLEDLWSPRFGSPSAVIDRAVADGGACVALAHNPDTADEAIWGRWRSWILSGHTHGGQCRPPFLPPPILPVRNRRYTAGRFELEGGRRLYINRGLGHLTKVRFNARPEITLHRLVADGAAGGSGGPSTGAPA